MLVSITLLSISLAPVLALIAWMGALWRMKHPQLLVLTLAVIIWVLVTTSGNLLLFLLNPYALLTLIALAGVNTLLLPHMTQIDRPYLVAMDTVLLLMLAAYHSWHLYLRQSELYFTESSALSGAFVALLLLLLSISLPVIHFSTRRKLVTGIATILIIILLSAIGAWWLV